MHLTVFTLHSTLHFVDKGWLAHFLFTAMYLEWSGIECLPAALGTEEDHDGGFCLRVTRRLNTNNIILCEDSAFLIYIDPVLHR